MCIPCILRRNGPTYFTSSSVFNYARKKNLQGCLRTPQNRSRGTLISNHSRVVLYDKLSQKFKEIALLDVGMLSERYNRSSEARKKVQKMIIPYSVRLFVNQRKSIFAVAPVSQLNSVSLILPL